MSTRAAWRRPVSTPPFRIRRVQVDAGRQGQLRRRPQVPAGPAALNARTSPGRTDAPPPAPPPPCTSHTPPGSTMNHRTRRPAHLLHPTHPRRRRPHRRRDRRPRPSRHPAHLHPARRRRQTRHPRPPHHRPVTDNGSRDRGRSGDRSALLSPWSAAHRSCRHQGVPGREAKCDTPAFAKGPGTRPGVSGCSGRGFPGDSVDDCSRRGGLRVRRIVRSSGRPGC